MKRIQPQPGLQIDGFTLGEKLHQGGFATIWDVTHPAQELPMVMKTPTILDGYDGPTIVGFEVEQMIMPRLRGPHVPGVIATGDFATLPYIVVERIAGGSLYPRFKAAPVPLSDLVDTAAGMAAALHSVHQQGVIHFDLKPDNFLQRPGGEMVLIDYGLSRHEALPDLLAEEFTIPMGTFPYIAPEQYLRQRKDLRSDIYALGAMIYELATGGMPFGVPETLKQVRKRLWRDPVPPRLLRPDLPEWLQEVILRAMEVDPAQRYQSAAQLLYDLQHPAQIRLTTRGYRSVVQSWGQIWRKWRRMRGVTSFGDPPAMGAQIARAPILLVAVDLSPEQEALSGAVLTSVKRMLVIEPEARVACVNVIKASRIGMDPTTDAEGNNLHVSRLLGLRAWAEGLDMPEGMLTFTVLEGTDPGQVLIDHAANLHVDHILMGARGHSGTRRYLGSVSAQVVAEAACSVTVVRLPEAREAPALVITAEGWR